MNTVVTSKEDILKTSRKLVLQNVEYPWVLFTIILIQKLHWYVPQ